MDITSYIKEPNPAENCLILNISIEPGDHGYDYNYTYPSKLIVPYGTKALYEQYADWNKCGQIIEMDETAIDDIDMKDSNRHAEIYNLAGQKLRNPRKGINVIDGKKVLVR